MCKFTFEFATFLFVFVLTGAKLMHLKETDIAKCNKDFVKCNL